MFLRTMAEIDAKLGIRNTLAKIDQACQKRSPELSCIKPRLIAASKTVPTNVIIEAYDEGQRHFGENYVQELYEKATSADIIEKCKDIRWHLIGHLQSNKINKVLSLPNLYMIETLDSKKLATSLNKRWPEFGPPDSKLKVMLQVNTSGEDVKSGIDPKDVVELAKYVIEECTNLDLDGFMTIGRYDYNPEDGPNPDYIRLKQCREEISQALKLDPTKFNLSMGMSSDFEQAIEMGSTSVRVGRTIFGERPPA